MTSSPVLSAADKEHFIQHGWVKVPAAFTPVQAQAMTEPVWTRLGMDPNDKATWHTQRTNMPSHNTFDASAFAPRAWSAITELLSSSDGPGESLISPQTREWRDSFIVNLGSPPAANAKSTASGAVEDAPPWKIWNWHVDGDFFIHYLDSPEQALLVIPLFTDIPPSGGGTMLYPGGMRVIAQHLYEHPEGVSPRMIPRTDELVNGQDFRLAQNPGWYNDIAKRTAEITSNDAERKKLFVEATGKTGDVYLLHPLMLHSATNNPLRNIRIITNPPVSIRQPFKFDRADGGYSVVEKATLRALGKDTLSGWAIQGPRERIVPERMKALQKVKEEEARRLEERKKLGINGRGAPLVS